MKSIFIIEDDYNYRSMLLIALEDEGYKVTTAENGQIAIDILKVLTPDIILSGCTKLNC